MHRNVDVIAQRLSQVRIALGHLAEFPAVHGRVKGSGRTPAAPALDPDLGLGALPNPPNLNALKPSGAAFTFSAQARHSALSSTFAGPPCEYTGICFAAVRRAVDRSAGR